MRRPSLPLLALAAALLLATPAFAVEITNGGNDETTEDFTVASSWAAAAAASPGTVAGAVIASHLLITEVGWRGLNSATLADSTEFLEIHNPTGAIIDLSTYHIADVNGYSALPVAGTIDLAANNTDFAFRFPAGATINPGQTLVIAIDGGRYRRGTGVDADFMLFNAGGGITSAQLMTDVGANKGATYPAFGSFTNGGEFVWLFEWSGACDLVVDIDLVYWGPGTGANLPVRKLTTTCQDGPDAGSATSCYFNDAGNPAGSFGRALTAPGNGTGTRQRAGAETETIAVGGNGAAPAAASSVTISSDNNPSTAGQKVNFTAAVTPGSATGSVEFFDGASSLGSAPIVDGAATISVSTLTPGSHIITAVYGGDCALAGSTSPGFKQTVNAGVVPTTTVLDVDPDKTFCGDTLRLEATVSPLGATDSVRFYDEGITIGSAAVDPLTGQAVLMYAGLPPGSHSLTAVYGGDALHSGSTSNKIFHEVNPQPTTLTLTVAGSQACGDSLVLVAQVSPDNPGNVEFFDGAASLGSASISGGSAVLVLPAGLPAGSHSLTAAFTPNGSCYDSSTSNKVTVDIDPIATSVALSVSPNLAKAAGDLVALVATVSPDSATGTIEFFDGATSLGTVPITGGYAFLTLKFPDDGIHTITAAYAGDSCFAPSVSPSVNLTVGATPTLTVTDTTAAEGQTGAPQITFRVRLSSPINQDVTVDYATEDGSAIAGVDYAATSGTLTFTTGQNQKTVAVTILNPNNDQGTNRDFRLRLSNATKAIIADSVGIGTILDDDTPAIVINNVSRNEDALVPSFTFTVSMHHGVSHTVSVDYTTQDNTATVANNDYVAQSGTLTFDPKEASKSITITINADSTKESDNVTPWETFLVLLSNPVGGTIADGLGVGTIQDDDAAPQIYVDDVTPTLEGSSGDLTPFVFRVRLQGASAVQQVRVNYTTVNGTAVAPGDYVAVSGQLTFDFKEREKFVTVLVVGDDVPNQGAAACEPNETFSLRLSNPRGGNIFDNTGDAVIVDDDCIVPVTLSLFRAEPVTAGIELRWQFADPAAFADVSLERGVARDGPWSAVSAELREEDGVAVALDRSVAAGGSYWYRLVGRSQSGASTVFGPIAASAGQGTLVLALGRISPNPTRGVTRVQFSLAREGDVRLVVVDLQGREVALLAKGVHGAGSYVATWSGEGDRGPLAPGLYFVSYRAGGRQFTQRVVLAR